MVYAAGLSDGAAWAFLSVNGAENQSIYQALTEHRGQINAKLDGGAEWEPGETQSWVGLQAEADPSDPTLNIEDVREWMAKNLLRLRTAVQPYLDSVMKEVADSPDHGDAE